MKISAPEVLSGSIHNRLLNASGDTIHGFRVVPGFMLAMLRDGGWRKLARPIDGKVFTNRSVEEWVLGKPWAGLHFPSWDALYAMLDRDPEDGTECKALLIENGAPANGAAADVRVMARHGGKREQPNNVGLKYANDLASTVARLKRDNPALAERVIRGELSANAAAIEAGFRKPTWTAPDDPERLAARVRQRYPGWTMVRVDSGNPEE